MGKVYLSSKGLRPDQDNSKLINSILERAKPNTILMWPEGTYPIGDTIIQDKVPVHWEPVGFQTTIIPTRPIAALVVATDSVISGLVFHGDFSIHSGRTGEQHHCIKVEAVVQMRNIHIRNWWGDGIHVSADVQRVPPRNASHSFFAHIYISETRDSGMYFRGGDANECRLEHIDIRDCLGTGMWDASFLGIESNDIMCHSNGRNFAATDGNNRTHFYGAYSEAGRQKDYFEGFTEYHGINTSGYHKGGHAVVYEGDLVSGFRFGDEHDTTASLIRINKEGMQFDRPGTTNGIRLQQSLPVSGGYPHYTLQHFDRMLNFFGAHKDAPTLYEDREIPFGALGLHAYFVGTRLFVMAKPDDPRFIVLNYETGLYEPFQFKYGDTLLNPDYSGDQGSPLQWVFTKQGWIEQF